MDEKLILGIKSAMGYVFFLHRSLHYENTMLYRPTQLSRVAEVVGMRGGQNDGTA
jgi:hypothetical protein